MQLINDIRNRSRGDTIIEALFAISIFSLVAVGGLSIMNKGTAISQRSLEITLVRQQIDAQAEMLRFLNASYTAAFDKNLPIAAYGTATPAYKWAEMSNNLKTGGLGVSAASTFGLNASGQCPDVPALFNNRIFVLDSNNKAAVQVLLSGNTGNFTSYPETFAQIRNVGGVLKSEGLWIEAVRAADADPILNKSQTNMGYIDFHIRACWNSVSQSVPMTLGTIVRLYEPR